MSYQFDQDEVRQDGREDLYGRRSRGGSEASFAQDGSEGRGGSEGVARHGQEGQHSMGGHPGQETGEWTRSDRGGANQLTRDPSFPPPIRYGGDARSEGRGSREGEHQGVFAYQRHAAPRYAEGMQDQERGGYNQRGRQGQAGYAQVGMSPSGTDYVGSQHYMGGGYPPGYQQSGYGEGNRSDYGAGWDQGGYRDRSPGREPYGAGGSFSDRYEQQHAMQGLQRYDQDYSSPYRGAYGAGGYGRGQSRMGSMSGGRGRGSMELDDDGPIESSYIGDFDRGNWARQYPGEGGAGASQGYSSRRHGGSGYAEQTGSGGNRWGSGSGRGFRGMGPRGYRRSDERLCEDINERLTDDDDIDASNISVDVTDGIVTLSGEVDARRLKHRIEDMVEACHGVQDIRNEIRVKRSTSGSGGSGSTGAGMGRPSDSNDRTGQSQSGASLSAGASDRTQDSTSGESGVSSASKKK